MTTTTDAPMRLAVFASGNGSNMEAIARAIEAGTLSAELVLCICNTPGAGALDRAERLGIPTSLLNPKDFSERSVYTNALLDVLREHDVTFIALAGYLRKIPEAVVDAYPNRILNIHPALLPAFGGKGMYGYRVLDAVLEAGVRWTGVTVHLIDAEYDTGPIVLQTPVEVRSDDTPETLATRIREVEHRLYPEALHLFAEGRVRIDGRRVLID